MNEEDNVPHDEIDDLVEAIEKTIDATETEPAIIATALAILTARYAVHHLNIGNREAFARHFITLMDTQEH